MNIALSIFLLLAILRVIRYCWVTIQAKRAIRSFLADSSCAILKIEADTVFRDYGSIRSAFLSSLSIRDYCVRYQLPDGSERTLNVLADFHPITGTLRSMNYSQ